MTFRERVLGISSRQLTLTVFFLTVTPRLICLAVAIHGNATVASFEDVVIANNLVAGNGYSLSAEYRNFLFYEVFLDAPLPDAVTSGSHPTALKAPFYPLLIWAVFTCFGANNLLAL